MSPQHFYLSLKNIGITPHLFFHALTIEHCRVPRNCLNTRLSVRDPASVNAMKQTQGSYGNGKTEFKDFSRTIPGLFSRTQFLPNFAYNTAKKMYFFTRKGQNEKAHLFSLILIPVIIKALRVLMETMSCDFSSCRLSRVLFCR